VVAGVVAVAVVMTSQELKHIRQPLRLTQEQLAEELDCHRNTVIRWETRDQDVPTLVARIIWIEPGPPGCRILTTPGRG
jgi:DNA-binding transcriptional regulator YiaG